MERGAMNNEQEDKSIQKIVDSKYQWIVKNDYDQATKSQKHCILIK